MTFKKIHFVTDSTCDIPPERLARHAIGVVPCYVNFGGQSHADDGREFTRESFYEQMPNFKPHATTSSPPPGVAERVINEMAEGADHVIIITAPSKLSGVYNTLRLSASKLPEGSYSLIDSGTTAMALGWQVLIAAEVAEQTGDVEAVREAISRVRAHQRLYATLATMEYLRNSGRVGWAAVSLGTLLQIKPIIEVRDGDVHSVARVRTFGKAVEELLRLTVEQAPLDRLAVLHTNNPDGAHSLFEQLGKQAPPDTIFVNLTVAVGTHVGPGAVGVATVSQAWRN